MSNILKNVLLTSRKVSICREWRRTSGEAGSDDVHLNAAMRWLSRAQDVSGTGGVSAAYNILTNSWGRAYRETTGYIIPTFLRCATYSRDQTYVERALRMGEWELGIQWDDGAFGEVLDDGHVSKKIFNTGQIILGLCALYDYSKDRRYLCALQKAADWLVLHQEEDGSWEKFTTAGHRTYHTRVAWALLEVCVRCSDQRYEIAAIRQLEWVMKQQNENGWFHATSLSDPLYPLTHLIGYTISGLIESSMLLGEKGHVYYQAACKALEGIASSRVHVILQGRAYLPSTFGSQWDSQSKDACPTGEAQIAFYFLKLGLLEKRKDFVECAEQSIYSLKRSQHIHDRNDNRRGGISGSFPLGGTYCPYMLINWGAKFFADLILLHITKNTNIRS